MNTIVNTLNNLVNAFRNPNFNGIGTYIAIFVAVVIAIIAVYAIIDGIKGAQESKRIEANCIARHEAIYNNIVAESKAQVAHMSKVASNSEARNFLAGY